jgi:hypothetical protein
MSYFQWLQASPPEKPGQGPWLANPAKARRRCCDARTNLMRFVNMEQQQQQRIENRQHRHL